VPGERSGQVASVTGADVIRRGAAGSHARRQTLVLAIGILCVFAALLPGRLTSWDAGLRLAVTRVLWTGDPLRASLLLGPG